jgi:hypothetical protein
MRRTVYDDVRPRADESLALPVGEQFRAAKRCGTRSAPACQEAQDVLRERQAKASGFSGEFGFQFGRQVEYQAHGCSSFAIIVAG